MRITLPARSTAFALLFVIVVFVASLGAARADGGLLDGRAFIADAGVRNKAADEKGDVITFAGGKFHSSVCDQWGYGRGEYKSSGGGGAQVEFEVETVSDKDGRLAWKGVVNGDSIEGTFIHFRKPSRLRPNPEPIEHWFKGKAKV